MPTAKPKPQYNAVVLKRIEVTPQLIILQVRPDDGVKDFKPGQFSVLGLFREAPRVAEADPEEVPEEKRKTLVRRAYSISSGSQRKEYLEFYISLVYSGELTPRLLALQPEDRLFVGPKMAGVFTLDKAPVDKNILLVATGTGLAPYVSMARTLSLGEGGCPIRPLAVLHGASYSWDLGYRAELEGLNAQCERFHYLPIVSRPEKDASWSGRTGRLTDWLDKPDLGEMCGFSLDPEQTQVFLCGNPGMIETAAEQLKARGYDPGTRKEPGNLHMEKYW